MSKTAADLLIERLAQWGVNVVFGLPGDGVNGLFEALRTHQDKIKFIQVRHEESAALAACGYAKYTGRLGVCLATSGPGGIHLLNGLYDAKCDGQPVLAITGHTFHDLIGTYYQQDVDLDKLYIDVAVYNQRVMSASHVPNVVDEAVRTALSRRGVAHITIPKDIQEWSSSNGHPASISEHAPGPYAPAYPLPHKNTLQAAAEVINAGSKVVILAGQGCLHARDEILRLAKMVAGPIIKPLLGKAVVPDDNPYTTGGIGLLGTAPSQDAINECDTLIIAGSSFPYLEFYPKEGRAVQIDLDPSRIGLRHPVEVGLVGDCREVLQSLIPLLHQKRDRSFLDKAQERMKSWNTLMKDQAMRDSMPMKPQRVIYELNRMLDRDAIVSADSGAVTTWAARYIEVRDEMQFSLSGTLATMANALPYSIAASLAYPHRQVVCIIGDGGFTMLMGEVATLVKYKLPVKVIVLKNDVLAMIKWEQIALEGNPQFGVQLQPIDFAAYATACGAAGFTVAKPDDAELVLREAFTCDGPAIVQAIVDPHEAPMPGNITMKQALKFSEALIRGQKDAWKIIKNVAEQQVREIV